MSKKQNISIEEIKELLQTHNLSFSDIAKIANEINKPEVHDENIKLTTKTSKCTFELTLSYPDFIIKRQTALQTKELVIAPSCDGMFIRTLNKNNEWTVEPLTEDNYSAFMSKAPVEEFNFTPDFYIKSVARGKVFGENLISFLKDPIVKKMIKDKCAPKLNATDIIYYDTSCVARQKSIYKIFPLIYKQYAEGYSDKVTYAIKNSPSLFIFVYQVYGIDNTRDFIENYDMCCFDIKSQYFPLGMYNFPKYADEKIINKLLDVKDREDVTESSIQSYLPCNIPIINMEYKAFREYCLYEAYRMGYYQLSDFLSTWADTIKMEYTAFGKVKEKYPKCLPVYHNKLSRMLRNDVYYKDKTFQKTFETAAAKYKSFEYTSNDGIYKFIVPLTVADVVHERDQQCNCLVSAGYMQKVINGDSILVFMRKEPCLDDSFVTIEISRGGIAQAFLASNVKPNKETRLVIKEYADNFNLLYNV